MLEEYNLKKEELSLLNVLDVDSLDEDFYNKYNTLSKIDLDKKDKTKKK